ncbi:MAG: extracellular solute-binding protein [Alphaproteobacteria bacterium]|nr:extracellular solute-binding protein [Alphaproteobacteria bacterium]
MLKKLFLSAAFVLGSATAAQAACAYNNSTDIKLLANAFPAWEVATTAMQECGNVTVDLDTESRNKLPDAFAANPAVYNIGGVATSSIIPLYDAGDLRPLDDLIAAHGAQLQPHQLIKYDGTTFGIAFFVNNQHWFYRKDIYDSLGLSAPETYADVLESAEAIKNAGVVDYPLGGTYKAGWNIAEEFVNMFLGHKGEFFKANNRPNLRNNEDAVATLEHMKKLTAYMDPEYLVSDSTYMQQQFQQGKIAMGNLWASRAAAVDNAEESTVVGLIEFSAAPKPTKDGRPASTLWWDGFVLSRNQSDASAAAAFQVALEGIDSEMAQNNPDAAVWIIEGAVPGRFAAGASATAAAGAVPYPGVSAMGIMHTALGNNVADFLTDKKSAKQVLRAVERDYLIAAREKGLIR